MGVDPNTALAGACDFPGRTLPEPLPEDPMPLVATWLREAAEGKVQPNPGAMTLATVDDHGEPRARIVLARGLDVSRGFVVFFTNYRSAKGRELAARPAASLVFHWDALDRQVRISGPVTKSPASESDAYYASRPVMSRLAGWASDQSEPIASRAALLEKNAQAERRFGLSPGVPRDDRGAPSPEVQRSLVVPRPPHWGGFRVWARRVELWLGHPARLHDRAVWERELTPAEVDGAAGFAAESGGTRRAWRAMRLQP